MNTKEIYITLEGDSRVTLNDLVITWTDRHGDHTGKVIGYGKTAERGGSPVTHEKDVYLVDCGDDGVREIRRHEMREIIKDLGTLYTCDAEGNNAEPVNVDDVPMTLDDNIYAFNANDGEGITYRHVTIDDNCSPDVDVVAIDRDGNYCGYFVFVGV